jgi:putative oxidoreductase
MNLGLLEMRPGRVMALAARAAELIGGLLLAAGLLTAVGAALVSAVRFTAIWAVYFAKGLWLTEGGYEYNLVLLPADRATARRDAHDPRPAGGA